MSETQKWAPGRSTRYISAKARTLSGTRFRTQFEITTSIESLSNGRCSISPRRNSTFRYPSFSALARAFATMSGVMSTP